VVSIKAQLEVGGLERRVEVVDDGSRLTVSAIPLIHLSPRAIHRGTRERRDLSRSPVVPAGVRTELKLCHQLGAAQVQCDPLFRVAFGGPGIPVICTTVKEQARVAIMIPVRVLDIARRLDLG